MKISAAIREYLIEIEVRKYTPKTVRGYRNSLNLFLRFCEQEAHIQEVEEINLAVVRQFSAFMSQRGRKGSYINGLLKVSKSFMKYIEIHEESPADYSAGLFVCTVQALINSDRAGNFAGTQAPGTNIYMARRAVDHCLHALDIGLPGTIGTPVGVRNLDTEGHALVAKFALSHPLHLLAVVTYGRLHRKQLI